MVRLSVRIDETLHERLLQRANGADLSLSEFVRSLLHQGAEPSRRYIYSSNDELIAICIQIFSILVVAVGRQSPEAVDEGMAHARLHLDERGLLDPKYGSEYEQHGVHGYTQGDRP